jgi:hypothetical protein
MKHIIHFVTGPGCPPPILVAGVLKLSVDIQESMTGMLENWNLIQ